MTSSNRLLEQVEQWLDLGVLRKVDWHWIKTLATRVDENNPDVLLAGMLVSQALGQGHVCLFLDEMMSQPFANLVQYDVLDQKGNRWDDTRWQTFLGEIGIHSVAGLISQLTRSALVDDIATTEFVRQSHAPMVLVDNRLYLRRYFDYEQAVVSYIKRAQALSLYDFEPQWLDQLFPTEAAMNETVQQVDWQKVAVANSALQAFSIISGGPGTGKTTTVTKLLALLVMQATSESRHLKIELAAPTGKAAARLTESIIKAKQRLKEENHIDATIMDLIPEQASTLHRLLGSRFGRSEFVHNIDNPLHLDVLLVDEASMVDLPMMAKLFMALPASARLILLGDKDQLASVEAGSVLADLTYGIESTSPSQQWLSQLTMMSNMSFDLPNLSNLVRLSDSKESEPNLSEANTQAAPIRQQLSLLSKSYRFDEQSGIGQLARAINQSNSSKALALLKQAPAVFEETANDTIAWQPLEKQITTHNQTALDIAYLAKGYEGYWQEVQACMAGKSTIRSLFEAFARYQILTAVRSGEFGVELLNHALEKHFYKQGYIQKESYWYAGKAVIVTRNDATLGLFNGDIGICMPDPESDFRLRVWFESPNGDIHGYLPSRLSDNEAVFVMTVHKSQGSEFEHVELILPSYDSSILTKELFYTGITRAKKRFRLWASLTTVRFALSTNVQRYSGLVKALW